MQKGTKDFSLRGMNEAKRPTNRSLRKLACLLSSAIAACSCAGQGGLVTVGVRPTDGGADSGAKAGPVPGSDVMNPIPEPNSSTDAATGASGASGSFANAGSGAAIGSPDAAIEDAGDAGIGAAGADGSLDTTEDECGAIPAQPAGAATSGRVSATGLIEYAVDAPNVFIGLRTTLAVPAPPPPNGSIFIWPGIQPAPQEANLRPIGNGALLSVLTWGPSCSPGAPESYSTWWIAPMYTNLSTSDPKYSGCHSGEVVPAEPAQLVDVDIHLDGTTWVQNVVNRDTRDASDFVMDLNGQEQGRVFFDIGLQTSNRPTEDIIFTSTVLFMESADPDACQPVRRGMNDFASKPRVSADGRHCCIDRIVLRAQGVAATTPDPP